MNAFEAFPEGGFRITDKGGDVPLVPEEYEGELLPPAELPGLSVVETEDTEFDRPIVQRVRFLDHDTGEDDTFEIELPGYGTDAADPHVWHTSGGRNDGEDPAPDEMYRGDPEPDESLVGDTGFFGFFTRGKKERADRFCRLAGWILRQRSIKALSKGYWKFRGEVDKVYEARANGGDCRLNAERAGWLTTPQIRTLFATFRRRHAQLNGRP